jgi:hypothetical protein
MSRLAGGDDSFVRHPGLETGSRSVTKVVYIGGSGRSGTTLLEQQLTRAPECVCVGEIRWVWDRGVRQNQLCSCGSPFNQCPFWNRVFMAAFGGFNTPEVMEMLGRQHRLDRFRYIPALAVRGIRSPAFQKRLDAHGAALTKLYAAIAKVSQREVVVDNSKAVTYAYLLAAIPTLDIRLLHLVRDSRAVAFSWSRKRVRPEVQDRVQYMPRFGPRRAAMIWLKANILTDVLRRRLRTSTLLRYEEYARDPTAIRRACANLRIGPPTDAADQCDGLSTDSWHSMSGNPLRFEGRASTIRVDEEWRAGMGVTPYAIVTALTGPMLIRYRYRLRRNGG